MMDQSTALAQLLRRERDVLLVEWRQKVRELPSARSLPVPTLNDHVPKLIDELIDTLHHPAWSLPAPPAASAASVEHGVQRAHHGYDIGEVVAEYGMLRSCIHTLAEIHGLPVRGGELQLLNGLLDRAIGVAVQAFAVQCELAEKKRRDEHLAFVAHDLRTPLNAVVLATSVLEKNGESGSERRRMVEVLKRNVRQLAQLVESVLHEHPEALAEERSVPQQRLLQLWPLVEQLITQLQPPRAGDHAIPLVNRVPDDLMVHADAAMLRRALQHLVEHALAQARVGHVRIGLQSLPGADAPACIEVVCAAHPDGAGFAAAAPWREWPEPRPDPRAAGRADEHPRLLVARSLIEAHGSALCIERDGRAFSFALPARLQTSD